MKKLISAFLWFSVCLLVLLPAAYAFIIYSFHGELSLNRPKLAEEAAKVIASLVLSITSLGISQAGERIKIRRRAGALAEVIRSMLGNERENISALLGAAPPPAQSNQFEELRVNREFSESLRDRIDSLDRVVRDSQQQLRKTEPEVIRLCNNLDDVLEQATAAILSYSKHPTRAGLDRFKRSLEALLGAAGEG